MTWGRIDRPLPAGPGCRAWRARRLWVALSLMGAAGCLVACENEQCQQARLDLAQTWEDLRDTATSRQQIPPATDLSEDAQKERIRVWTEIEAKAELLRSSFGTAQVTWKPAQKARAELETLFSPVSKGADPVVQGFASTLKSADQRMASYDETCR